MKRSARVRLGIFLASAAWVLATIGYSSKLTPEMTGGDPPPTAEQANFFETKIRPVLVQNCIGCHGSTAQNSGLRLDSGVAIKKGGDSGPALVSGDPDKSLIIQAVRQTGDLKMPPNGKKLLPNEIADLETWVKMGAPWPSETASVASSTALWSLQPVHKPSIPHVHGVVWKGNPVDAFVLSRLEANHLVSSPPADRRTLIRRVTYDLIGLPPSPSEIESFLSDTKPGAYERVVDRLLNSPQYGERQARHWMDVARYADTKGYVFDEDRNFPNAYTYRDWLINAFNRDLPYDQFIIDQLAADRLPEVQDKTDRSPLAAMGFLTLGRRFLNQQPDIIDDRIDVTMRGLEGFTVGCARCHDHKFDPIPTQDYYSLYAVFASSDDQLAAISPNNLSEPWERYNQQKRALEDGIRDIALQQIALLRTQKPESLAPEVSKALQGFREGVIPPDGTLNLLVRAFEPAARERYMKSQTDLANLNRTPPPTPELAMALMDNANPRDGVVFHHGNPGNPGIAAPRRFLLALSPPGVERPHWTQGSGRLELARAIASKENPLTARVFVNRVWQDHFGAGIVRTPSDFGRQGERPTDPKLLDFLAASFMDDGWSIKKLHRLIVTSATYRQSSDVSPEAFNADPDNRYWGRMNRRRLDLEQMRDTLMLAAGRLQDDKLGGASVDLWSQPFSPRRAVYGFIDRQNLPGTFRTFDFASPDSTSAKRFLTTVPQQALFFMNSPFVIEEARQLTLRPEIAKAKDDEVRVRRLYWYLFGRLPDQMEMKTGLSYLRSQPGLMTMPTPTWEYGYGGYDEVAQRTVGFTPFAQFSGDRYSPTDRFPDPDFGFVMLSSFGGHPGRDANHAAIRRWTSPYSGTISLQGTLTHNNANGDGVRGRIVSSRRGKLGEWLVHNSNAQTNIPNLEVLRGETLDFMVDCLANDGFDSFAWAPRLSRPLGAQTWDARQAFGPPPGSPLTGLALYAQALMMTNEFVFVD